MNTTKQQEKCDWCDGTGKIDMTGQVTHSYEGSTCSKCHGTGKVTGEGNAPRKHVVRYMDKHNIGAIFSDTLQEWFYPSRVTDEIASILIGEKIELR